ncbi:MAG: hypothetical protein MUF18_19245, partial [Fimbriiglobus sp.]|nr:hypothetical protein [Fimbriiglobus sp.]
MSPGTITAYSPGQPFHLWARQFKPKPFAAVGFNIAVDFPAVGGHPAFALPSEIIRGVLQKGEAAAQADLLRCIVGNPFRPVAFATGWRSESSVALAATIYADRAFDRLPLLA